MLTAIMLLLAISVVASEGAITPEAIYAGVKTITLKYAEEINPDNMGEISVSDNNGEMVETTPNFEGKILTLSFADRSDITNDYILAINNTKYVIT